MPAGARRAQFRSGFQRFRGPCVAGTHLPRSEFRSASRPAWVRPTSSASHRLCRSAQCDSIRVGGPCGSTREHLRPLMRMPRSRAPRRCGAPHPPCERGRAAGENPKQTPPRSAGGFRPRSGTGIPSRWPSSARGSLSVPGSLPGPRCHVQDGRSSLWVVGRHSAAHLPGNNSPLALRHARRDRCGLQDELGWPCRQSPPMPVPVRPERFGHCSDAATQRTPGRRSSPACG